VNEYIGVSPDYIVHVRRDILEEYDGPMLQHALKDLQGRSIILPMHRNQWPSKEALEWRFHRFNEP